jgi:hypothetical protein
MHVHSKIAERIELEDGTFSEDAVSEGLRIEEILRRAHEIHRGRGGLIGYDLEDWLQAEREWIEDISHPISGSKVRSSEPCSLEFRTPCFDRLETGGPS